MQSAEISSTLHQLLFKYDSMHRHPKSWMLHVVAIPMIAIGTTGLTALIRWQDSFCLNGSIILFLINAIYFLPKDRRAGLLMLMANLPFFIIAPYLPGWLSLSFFVIGWGLATSGHLVFEKNKPAALSNLLETLVGMGPMYLMCRTLGWFRPT